MPVSPVCFGQSNVSYLVLNNNNQTDRNNSRIHGQETDGNEPKQLVGSVKTDVAKRGFKYVLKKCKNFIVKIFKGDEETIKTTIDTCNNIDKIHKTIDIVDNMTDPNSY